jgi:hypothetical protein
MHSYENNVGCQLVYEIGTYTLFQYCGLVNMSENFLGYQRGNSPMKIFIGME